MKTITYKTNISAFIRRLVRKVAGAHSNCPIEIILGSDAPKLVGNGWHYVNKSGNIIHHPNAYRRAWGKPIYINSTRRVIVGACWLMNDLSIEKIRLEKFRALT